MWPRGWFKFCSPSAPTCRSSKLYYRPGVAHGQLGLQLHTLLALPRTPCLSISLFFSPLIHQVLSQRVQLQSYHFEEPNTYHSAGFFTCVMYSSKYISAIIIFLSFPSLQTRLELPFYPHLPQASLDFLHSGCIFAYLSASC